jgi:LysR family transcriptional regulator, low CO2-responsive transcriptional regulator
MNYTLNQLRIFSKVAQLQSITKASEELYLTQPAVSIQLRNFQDQFQIPLTELIGRKLYVTDFGKEIAIAAEKILNEVHAINYKTLAYKGQLSGKLKIAIVSTAKYIAPYFVAGFLKEHQGIELLLDVTNKQKVLENLDKNEIDFAMVSVLPDRLSVNHIELMPNKLFLVGNNDKVFAKKKHDYKVFRELPIIYREPGSGTRYVMEQFIEEKKLKVQKKFELTSNEAVKQALLAGLGYSFMPLIGIKNELMNNDLQIIPVKGLPIISKWHLIWMKEKDFSPVAKAFRDHIIKRKDVIMKDKFDWYEKYKF